MLHESEWGMCPPYRSLPFSLPHQLLAPQLTCSTSGVHSPSPSPSPCLLSGSPLTFCSPQTSDLLPETEASPSAGIQSDLYTLHILRKHTHKHTHACSVDSWPSCPGHRLLGWGAPPGSVIMHWLPYVYFSTLPSSWEMTLDNLHFVHFYSGIIL